MKIWITKWALTLGIIEIDRSYSNYYGEVIVCPIAGRDRHLLIGSDCFLEKDAAINKSQDMKIAKILSLQRQINRIEKLEFK